MKKSKKIIIILSLLLAVIAISIGGYTYAKYKTSVKGKGELDIAKWSFIVNNNSEQIETIKLTDTVDEKLLANGKVAPGTGGEFTINIDGSGTEVGINYEVKFTNERNKPTNLIFTYEGKQYRNLEEISEVIKGNINANEINKTKEFTIGWEWKYETGTQAEIVNNDKIDTQEGISNLDYTFDVTVTGVQAPIV